MNDGATLTATRRAGSPASTETEFGLTLSTTDEAAFAYNRGLSAVLRVQAGAETHFAESVRIDPGFAAGHAALALLGHEFGAPVDVPTALRRAELAVPNASAWERSHIGAVVNRIRLDAGAGATSMLRHVIGHPTDALMVSAAVPTIAFSGVTDVPDEAWGLVETLKPAYGDHWWYLSMLAFVRQDQQRWTEAFDLASRALALEPGSGHAVHARAHVHYETGDHGPGRSWITDWIATAGLEAHHLAHFAWHAALHDLALGDRTALRLRFEQQLAPPKVTGMRALVDSASLLWRCSLEHVWDGPLPIGDVLRTAGDLVDRPPSAFAGLHAALALATAGDVAGLDRLRRYVAADGRPVYSEILAPLVSALQDYCSDRFDEAATGLMALQGRLVPLGGSMAQREVVEDTLIHALIGADRLAEAGHLLDRRLDRRPSRLDLCRLTSLHRRTLVELALRPLVE